ncbi:hypothetical protein F2Q68_00005175 [Brassica cretica]|uniref:Uncharacterized protein n=1 Tax=Brassica cretica TaxID=69181 RepID=A0A8S9J795_BRACR|nr:hypothetical protein F2Q68_00005175 [Brassica cretica]
MTISILREEIWKLHQRLASIDTKLVRSIDNYPTSSINAHPKSSIDNQELASIYTHTPSSIDNHPIASVDTHEEATGFHKRVKRIHDHVKFVVPCAVFKAESPIPPDRSIYILVPGTTMKRRFQGFSKKEHSHSRTIRARRHYGKKDEQHGFGEPSKVEIANTSDPTSASINSSTSKSIDIGTSETIDTKFYHRSIPLEIPERSSCPQDIADSTHKSTDVSSCSPSPDVEKEITMEDFLELEEFLELEDGDLDSSRAVTMEDFLELEE